MPGMDQLTPTLLEQDGVVSRRQALSLGLSDHALARLVRRRELTRVHPGVYVDHTGSLSWPQRAWAAVLFYWPAALWRESSLRAFGLRGMDESKIHVAIDASRTGVRIGGVSLHRSTHFDQRVRWNLSPPRFNLDDSVLDACAAARSPSAALAIAADACQQHRTTGQRLLQKSVSRQRMRHGQFLRDRLIDVSEGALSLLESGYLRKVERAHHLPRGRRQCSRRDRDGIAYRDVEYEDFGIVVELDGRLGHEWTAERWQDMDRDLLAAAWGQMTIRLGWRHVEDCGCITAERLGQVFLARGWSQRPMPCSAGCGLTGAA